MDLTLVVISFNTHDLLERCLTTASVQLSGVRHEIVVVDNASDDGSAEMVAADFPQVTLIRNVENRGFAHAVNQAIRASSGRHVLLLNSDATLEDGAIAMMTEYLASHPRVGAVGGMLLNPDGTFQGSYSSFPSLLSETLLLTGLSRWLLPPTFPSYPEAESQQQRTVDWVCGAFIMLRRDALDDVGLFDEAYFMYAEEVDWCRRARHQGWSLAYLPEARAVHLVGGSYRRAPVRRRAQIYRSKWIYLQKHHGRLTAALFRRLVQSCSIAKLMAWALAGLSGDRSRRATANLNVASYRYLLSHF